MENRNVLLITVDSLRWDVISKMPKLHPFAEESTYFTRAYASGPSTPFSFPSLFSRRYNTLNDPIKIRTPSLAEEMRDRGYRTLGVVASNPYISSIAGYEAGFDRFQDYITKGGREVRGNIWKAFNNLPDIFKDMRDIYKWYWKSDITSSQSGDVVIETCQDWLDSLEDRKPFFLWTHFMDTHSPYIPPLDATDFSIGDIISLNKFRKDRRIEGPQKPEKKISRLRSLYLDTVRWLDDRLFRLFSFLKKNDLWDKTDIIVTSDHGEAFGEHGFLGHPSQIYEENVRIPLIMKMKGLLDGHDGLVEMRDIPSTLLSGDPSDAQNLKDHPEKDRYIPLRARHAGGRSCMKKGMNLIDSPESLKYGIYGYVTEKYKFIYDEEGPKVELYDLEKDPEEKKDISSQREEVLDEFVSKLESDRV